MQIDPDSAGVRFPPPIAFAGTLLAGWVLGRLLGSPGIPLHGWHMVRNLGWLGLFAGAAILMSAAGLFRKSGTNIEPWKPVSALVTDGVYRWTRNPMYLGMTLIYAGAALLLDSFVALALLIPLIIVIRKEVIEREEAYMTARFGDEYRDYQARTRRWF